MSKRYDLKKQIQDNKQILSSMLSGTNTVKRLNNLNWLRHQFAYEEPRTLFPMKSSQQGPYLDYTNMQNLGKVYDLISTPSKDAIDELFICRIHSMLCENTNIQGGAFRTSGKVLEIFINGSRYHAPSAHMIQPELGNIVYKLHYGKDDVITKAIGIHYDLIALQPFDDFNKRTARIIMNAFLIQNGYRPILFNKPSDKQNYRNAIAARTAGDSKTYSEYMYQCLLRTQREIIKTITKSKMM